MMSAFSALEVGVFCFGGRCISFDKSGEVFI